jgi:hypothetical protein
LILFPVPTPYVDQFLPLISPFLPSIAERGNETVEDLISQMKTGEVQAHLVWDGRQAHALVGTRLLQRANGLLGEVVWTTGQDRASWIGLLSDLEIYLRDHIGCTAVRAIARLGWTKELKRRGYRASHVILEKELR